MYDLSAKIPLNMPKAERNGHAFPDGSYIRVWIWEKVPELLRLHLQGRMAVPELVVLCPRSCDQFSVSIFCEYIGSEPYKRCGEIDLEGVACSAYLIGRSS